MSKAQQLTTTVATMLMVAAFATPVAFARPADPGGPQTTAPAVQDNRTPDRQDSEGIGSTTGVPARVDSIGVAPASRTAAPAAPVAATPSVAPTALTTPDDTGGLDWLSVLIGAAGVVGLGLVALAVRSGLPARMKFHRA